MRKLAAILLCAAVIVFVMAKLAGRRVETTTNPMTLSQARNDYGLVDLPTTATEIYFARFSGFLGGRAVLIRFQAPVGDCMAFATNYCQSFLRSQQIPAALNWSAVSQPPKTPSTSAYGINAPWFDLTRLQAGVELSEPATYCPSVWIDTHTGTFYSFWTD